MHCSVGKNFPNLETSLFSRASTSSLDTDPKAFERTLNPGLGRGYLQGQGLWVQVPKAQDEARGTGTHISALPSWAQTAREAPALRQFGQRAGGLLIFRHAT